MASPGTIKSIRDIMRKDVGVDGDAQRIGQLVWMLFLKIFDDREAEQELLTNGYVSPIPEKLRWRSWAADDEGITGDELLSLRGHVLQVFMVSWSPDGRRLLSAGADAVKVWDAPGYGRVGQDW